MLLWATFKVSFISLASMSGKKNFSEYGFKCNNCYCTMQQLYC